MNPVRSFCRAFGQTSRTFRSELIATALTGLFVTTHAEAITANLPRLAVPLALVAICYLAKILLMAHLNRQGGEAWDLGHSPKLVTGGIFKFNRNPVYSVVLAQYAIWVVIVALCETSAEGARDGWLAADAWMAGTATVLAGMWLFFDRFAVPREEETLLADHGADFAAYCRIVPRWAPTPSLKGVFGARRAPASENVPAE